jgi:hypothetical protein
LVISSIHHQLMRIGLTNIAHGCEPSKRVEGV